MHTLFENYKALQLQTPATVSADGQTTGVAVGSEYLDDAVVIISIGADGGTSPTIQIDIQTSDAVAGTYTTVVASPSYDADDQDTIKIFNVNLDGPNSNGEDQKFIRLDYDLGGTSPTFVLSAVLLIKAQVGKSDLNSSAAA